VIITGSNASYNYTKDSDLDIHIVADISDLEDPAKLYPLIYDAYKSLFNKRLDIKFYEIPVEIYVETQETPLVSNGIYSVKNNK
jgi:predicted nucleotidyltransferase